MSPLLVVWVTVWAVEMVCKLALDRLSRPGSEELELLGKVSHLKAEIRQVPTHATARPQRVCRSSGPCLPTSSLFLCPVLPCQRRSPEQFVQCSKLEREKIELEKAIQALQGTVFSKLLAACAAQRHGSCGDAF